jgi:hypothetical protein
VRRSGKKGQSAPCPGRCPRPHDGFMPAGTGGTSRTGRPPGGGIHMNKPLAKVTRPASDSETAGSVSAAPARLGRIARIARMVAVPVVAAAALAGAAGSAHAAASSVGQISMTVFCITDTSRHTAQIKVDASAIVSRSPSQAVAYRYGYYTARGIVASGWSGATWVKYIPPKYDAYGTDPVTYTEDWTSLPSASWSVTPGTGQITAMVVQGAFWNGTAYDYSQWYWATYYTSINGYTNGQAAGNTVPCSV